MDGEYREDARVSTLSDTVPWFYVELSHPVTDPLVTLITTNTKRVNIDATQLEMWIGSKRAGKNGDPWATMLPLDAVKCGTLSGGVNQNNDVGLVGEGTRRIRAELGSYYFKILRLPIMIR